MVAENVAFGIIAAAMAFGALGVVRTQNIVHAALFLVVVLAGAAAQYLLLGAEFVSFAQVLVYVGAVAVLIVFAILLTPAVNDLTPDCSTGRVVGYFFGNDLLTSASGSNKREIFYAFTTKAGTVGSSTIATPCSRQVKRQISATSPSPSSRKTR